MNIRNRWISAGVIVSLLISGITLLTTERTTLMANPTPPPTDFMQRLQERIDKLDRRISELATFDATQYSRVVRKMSSFEIVSATTTGITGLPTTPVDVVVATITVPEGYTTALVQSSVLIGLRNTATGGWGNLWIQSRIQDDVDGPLINPVEGGQFGSGNLTQVKILTGLTGGDIITVAAQAAFFSTHDITRATVNASATFLK